jgi:hypothetical protein
MRSRHVPSGHAFLAALLVSVSGCSEGAKLARETDSGGVVTYLYREDRGGVLGSRYRRDALRIVEKKCPGGYSIVREGEAQGSRSGAGIMEGTEDETSGRRWALQFRCK